MRDEKTLKQVIVMKDISDGLVVSSAIGTYVNSYCAPGKRFYECMLSKSINVQHDFTLLCLEWFKTLANTTSVDGRNLASHQFAKKAVNEYCNETLNKRRVSAKGVNRYFEFDYRDDEQAAALLERYLCTSENNEKFLSGMLYVHKTCQQLFSKLCLEWLKHVSELPFQRKQYVVLARKVMKHYTRFPMV